MPHVELSKSDVLAVALQMNKGFRWPVVHRIRADEENINPALQDDPVDGLADSARERLSSPCHRQLIPEPYCS